MKMVFLFFSISAMPRYLFFSLQRRQDLRLKRKMPLCNVTLNEFEETYPVRRVGPRCVWHSSGRLTDTVR